MEFVSTVEFKMNYLHAVHLHDELVAKGIVDHAGNTLVVSSCVIYRVQRRPAPMWPWPAAWAPSTATRPPSATLPSW